MPMSQEKLEAARAYLAPRLRGAGASCGGQQWEISDQLWVFPAFDLQQKMPVEGVGFPAILVTCTGCSATQVFSAMKMGLL